MDQSNREIYSIKAWIPCDTDGPYYAVSHIWGNAGYEIGGTSLEWVVPILENRAKAALLDQLVKKHYAGKTLWIDIKDVPQKDRAGKPVKAEGVHDAIRRAGEIYYNARVVYVVLEYDPFKECGFKIQRDSWYNQEYYKRVWTMQEDAMARKKEYYCYDKTLEKYNHYTLEACPDYVEDPFLRAEVWGWEEIPEAGSPATPESTVRLSDLEFQPHDGDMEYRLPMHAVKEGKWIGAWDPKEYMMREMLNYSRNATFAKDHFYALSSILGIELPNYDNFDGKELAAAWVAGLLSAGIPVLNWRGLDGPYQKDGYGKTVVTRDSGYAETLEFRVNRVKNPFSHNSIEFSDDWQAKDVGSKAVAMSLKTWYRECLLVASEWGQRATIRAGYTKSGAARGRGQEVVTVILRSDWAYMVEVGREALRQPNERVYDTRKHVWAGAACVELRDGEGSVNLDKLTVYFQRGENDRLAVIVGYGSPDSYHVVAWRNTEFEAIEQVLPVPASQRRKVVLHVV
ncbi:hypothetical protein DFJ73DRAFT_817243 [Zopfochytrium polystomum]|nr:hypothetical protein DFJ73DRAFT_817243 [Zopfochytrium polystomum]